MLRQITHRRLRWIGGTTFAVSLVATVVLLVSPSHIWLGRFDFRAFYCAARILQMHGDPYLYGPLHSCELAVSGLPPNGVVPAPLPPYAIAFFVPISLLPFAWANVCWQLIIVGAALTFAVCTSRLSSLPLWFTTVCAASVLLAEPLLNGALPPVPLALLCGAAVAITQRRWTTATLLLALAAVQPHLALPPMLATFFLIPAMRWRLLCVLVALGALSLAAGGLSLNAEYAFAVLPAHAASEIGAYGQYGLASILYLFGVPTHPALLAASVQYAVFVALGIAVAARLRNAIPAAAVLVPLAFALTGGTFVHQTEIAGALPLALVLTARYGSTLAWIAAALLAVPWEWVTGVGLGIVAGVVIASVLGLRGGKSLASTVIGAAATVALTAYSVYLHPVIAPSPIAPSAANALAEQAWAAWQRSYPAQPFWLPAHVLTYAGLGCLFATIWETLRRPAAPGNSTVEGASSALP